MVSAFLVVLLALCLQVTEDTTGVANLLRAVAGASRTTSRVVRAKRFGVSSEGVVVRVTELEASSVPRGTALRGSFESN